jgi:hypothetical protein
MREYYVQPVHVVVHLCTVLPLSHAASLQFFLIYLHLMVINHMKTGSVEVDLGPE